MGLIARMLLLSQSSQRNVDVEPLTMCVMKDSSRLLSAETKRKGVLVMVRTSWLRK
jgi:hypothetical protein